jgi:hypothetical protein
MNEDKKFTVKVYIDGETTTYKECDVEFIITLLTCPACSTKEFAMNIWDKDFAETVKFFNPSA